MTATGVRRRSHASRTWTRSVLKGRVTVFVAGGGGKGFGVEGNWGVFAVGGGGSVSAAEGNGNVFAVQCRGKVSAVEGRGPFPGVCLVLRAR